jgi:hypothetical protein
MLNLSTWAFGPLRGMAKSGLRSREPPVSHYVPLLGFLNLSTVYSPTRFHRPISSGNHVQDSPVQGLPPPCSSQTSSVFDAPLSLRLQPLHIRRCSRSRCPSTSRLCSTRRCVLSDWFDPHRQSLPSSGCSSSRFVASALGSGLPSAIRS